jgi:hypothetical protein
MSRLLGSETEFQGRILDLATLYGWTLRYHTYDSRRSTSGWPDLVLIRPPELLFVEVKREDGQVTPSQLEFITALRACGQDVRLWRPSDWDEIVERLKWKRPRLTRFPTGQQ